MTRFQCKLIFLNDKEFHTLFLLKFYYVKKNSNFRKKNNKKNILEKMITSIIRIFYFFQRFFSFIFFDTFWFLNDISRSNRKDNINFYEDYRKGYCIPWCKAKKKCRSCWCQLSLASTITTTKMQEMNENFRWNTTKYR